jgi:putative NADH-flavin reductase
MSKIAVFGASGHTGKPFTDLALKNGYEVKALVRIPSKLEIQHPALQVIQGDALDPAKVEETITGTDAVIDVLGPVSNSPGDLRRTAGRHIVQTMQQHNVKRLITLASLPLGVVDNKDQLNLGLRIKMFLAKILLKEFSQDARQHASLIKNTALDWTVVRAPGLANQLAQGKYRVGFVGSEMGNSITNADLAAFLLDELRNAKYIRQMPLVSN